MPIGRLHEVEEPRRARLPRLADAVEVHVARLAEPRQRAVVERERVKVALERVERVDERRRRDKAILRRVRAGLPRQGAAESLHDGCRLSGVSRRDLGTCSATISPISRFCASVHLLRSHWIGRSRIHSAATAQNSLSVHSKTRLQVNVGSRPHASVNGSVASWPNTLVMAETVRRVTERLVDQPSCCMYRLFDSFSWHAPVSHRKSSATAGSQP